MYHVQVSAEIDRRIVAWCGEERNAEGRPSATDFRSTVLAAAKFGFRGFDELPIDLVPQVRTLHVLDPHFGAVVFTAIKVASDVVEIADFDIDPDYWDTIANDPDE